MSLFCVVKKMCNLVEYLLKQSTGFNHFCMKIKILFYILFVNLFFVICVQAQNSQIKVEQKPNDSLKNISPSNITKINSKIDESNYFDGNTSVKIEGTSITITPPKTFHFKDGSKNTFIQDWTSSSILVQEINASYEKLIPTITNETFTKQGYNFVSKYEVFTKSGNAGMMYVLTFKTGDWEYERLVLLSGDKTKTAWISANYPVVMRHLLYEVLEKCVLNIEF